MVLVHRYHASVENSELLSTSADNTLNRNGKTHPRQALMEEANDWIEAICPPVEDVCDLISRLQNDPDVSEENAFYLCVPPSLFIAILLYASSMVREDGRQQQHQKDNSEVLWRLAVYGGMMCIGLVTLRVMIWLGSRGVKRTVDHRKRENVVVKNKSNSPLLKQQAQFNGIPM